MREERDLTPPAEPRVDVLLDGETLRETLRREAVAGLRSVPKALSPKWFYDERGCELFEQITTLEEYYPTRREAEILKARASSIVRLTGADTVIELGSGSSSKTRILLDAFSSSGRLGTFVPFDVSEAAIRGAIASLSRDYPALSLHAIVGDFDHHLDRLPLEGRRLVVFLGGTIGNFTPEQRSVFLGRLAGAMRSGDALLLGTDLVKPSPRLEAAYNDSSGVTAEFNLNLLNVLNRELGANFDASTFEHVARFDPIEEWIEMHLRSRVDQVVALPSAGIEVRFGAGEEMRTEISAKFRRAGVEKELAAADLDLAEWWTDEAGDFAVSLSLAS